jgi:hypothetical protein
MEQLNFYYVYYYINNINTWCEYLYNLHESCRSEVRLGQRGQTRACDSGVRESPLHSRNRSSLFGEIEFDPALVVPKRSVVKGKP